MSAFLHFTVSLLFISRPIVGVELYLTNDWNEDILSYSTESGKLKSYPTTVAPKDAVVAPAVICNDIYYSFYLLDGVDFLLFSYNITSNESTLFNGAAFYPVVSVSCTSTNGELLAVSVEPSATYSPIYLLKRATTNGNQVSNDLIGRFDYHDELPYPVASIFSFNLKSDELWVCFPKTGKLQIMDTKNGQIKETYSYPNGNGAVPYFTIPQTLSDRSFKGAMKSPDNGIAFVTITMRQSQLDVRTDSNNAVYLDSNGEAMAICNDTGYIVAGGIGNKISSFNINTGAMTATYNLPSDAKRATAIACKE